MKEAEDKEKDKSQAPKSVPYTYSVPECVMVVEEAQAKYELRGGYLYDMAGGSPEHALLIANITSELRNSLKSKRSSCRVYSSDLMLHAWQEDSLLFPDATVVCGSPEYSEVCDMALVNPSLIVEVLSPSTAARDRGQKFETYKRFDSFKTYILISQDTQYIEVFMKDKTGFWQRRKHDGRLDVLDIPNMGLVLDWESIYDGLERLPARPL